MEKDSSVDENASLTRNSSSSNSTKSNTSSSSGFKICKTTCINVDPSSEKVHRCSQECIQKYPIHHAARLGDFLKLKSLLEDPNAPLCPLQPDECLGRTPLHYACATGNVDKGLLCTKLLLECRQVTNHPDAAKKVKVYVNHLDYMRKSALHLAAMNEATQIVIELLTNQANFDISSVDGVCALREIYKNTPDAMEEALNQSIHYVENCGRPNLPWDNVSTLNGNEFDFTHTCVNCCLDFYPVIGSKMTPEECQAYEAHKGSASCRRKKLKLTPETGFLFTVNRKRMEANVRRQILTNALVQAFLYFKWQKVKWFCFVAIFFHAVWLSMYIGTVINVFVMQCPYQTKVEVDGDPVHLELDTSGKENETSGANAIKGLSICKNDFFTELFAGVLLMMSIGVSLKEMFQFIRLRSLYIRFENLGQCTLLIFIFITVPQIYLYPQFTISSIHFQISAFGIFLGWTLLLCQLAKLPQLSFRFNKFGRKGMIVFPDHGIYVEILSRVFKNFLIFISIFSSLLISFVFSFNILLPNSTGFVNLTNAMVKVLTMMTGELNYDEIFHSEDSKLVYPISSHVMYAIFIMVATIILFNLLIGFTVSDIQGLQKDAEINQISNKLEQIFLMECFLLSGSVQKLVRLLSKLTFRKSLEPLNKIMVVKTTNSNVLCYHTTLKVLPYSLRVKIRNHASKNCLAISDISGIARSKMFTQNQNPNNFNHRDFEH